MTCQSSRFFETIVNYYFDEKASCWANICYFVPRPILSSSTIPLTFHYLENERQKSGSLNSNLVQNVIQRLWFLLGSVSSNSVTVIATSIPSLPHWLRTGEHLVIGNEIVFKFLAVGSIFYNNFLFADDRNNYRIETNLNIRVI